MTTDRALDQQLGAWLDERSTTSVPDGLLERSLARVETIRQRPGWLASLRGSALPRPTWPIGRPAVSLLQLAAVVGLLLALVVGAIVAGALRSQPIKPAVLDGVDDLRSQPVTLVTPTPAGTTGLGSLIAFTKIVDKPNTSPEDPSVSLCYTYDSTCPIFRLWIVRSDGSGAHELFPDGYGGQTSGAWSPDGSQLIFSDSGRLYLTDASGREPQVADTGCVKPCAEDRDASFSPDGTRLVFARLVTEGGSGVIATMDLASGRVVELRSTTPVGGMLPTWSPDGAQIVFSRVSGNLVARAEVFVVDADGQNLHQVSPVGLPVGHAGWSPDGARIVLTSDDSYDPDPTGAVHQDIYTVRPDGTDLRQLTTDGMSKWATWTPDGRILFTRGSDFFPNGGDLGFWTMDADGGNAAELIAGVMPGDADLRWAGAPAWQPIGGRSIVPPPWTPSTATSVGPPPPTPPATPKPDLSAGFSWTGSMRATEAGPLGETATLLADGRVLVTGGCSTDVELYDPETGTFSQTGSLTAIRGGKTATLLQDGRILITGGYNCADAEHAGIWASAELYDPTTGSFRPTGSMGTAREFHTATLLADGRVLMSGGITGASPLATRSVVLASYQDAVTAETSSNVLSSAELYDPATGTFSRTGSMSNFRDHHTATLLQDGRVLVVGGGGEGYASRTSAELYDPATGTFGPTGSMKSGRWLHTATLLQDGRVLVAGGRTPQDSVLASAELYNPRTGKFASTGSLTTGRQEHTATLLGDGRVLLTGGYNQDDGYGQALASTELFDPGAGKFTSAGSMGDRRAGQTATLLDDGRVLIAGGFYIGDDGGAGLTSAVFYQP
jgi:Tol biopolymer transport system component